jgi:HK97 gp10 family phage protein
VLKSRLPEIAAELVAKANAIPGAGAELVVAHAKDRVPVDTGRLRDAIHVEESEGGHMVVAGDKQAFYGHIVEHGSRNTPPHPFLIPAAEESRKEIEALALKAGKSL